LSPHFVHLPSHVGPAGSIWLEASIDGIVVSDSEGTVAAFLAGIRQEIAEGRFVRRMAHGHPYWKRAD
jgi:hypothetical protein